MKTSRSNTRSHRLSLSDHELGLILGALAETLEEHQTPYSRKNLASIVRLHRRLERLAGCDEHDYTLKSGAVVCARNTDQVVAVSNRWRDLGATHG